MLHQPPILLLLREFQPSDLLCHRLLLLTCLLNHVKRQGLLMLVRLPLRLGLKVLEHYSVIMVIFKHF